MEKENKEIKELLERYKNGDKLSEEELIFISSLIHAEKTANLAMSDIEKVKKSTDDLMVNTSIKR